MHVTWLALVASLGDLPSLDPRIVASGYLLQARTNIPPRGVRAHFLKSVSCSA